MKNFLALLILLIVTGISSQNDQEMIKKIFDNSMSSSISYGH